MKVVGPLSVKFPRFPGVTPFQVTFTLDDQHPCNLVAGAAKLAAWLPLSRSLFRPQLQSRLSIHPTRDFQEWFQNRGCNGWSVPSVEGKKNCGWVKGCAAAVRDIIT